MIQRKKPFSVIDAGLILLMLAAVAWLIYRINVKLHYHWNWPVLFQYILRFDESTARWVPGLILQGVFTTLRLSVWSMIAALLLGVIMGLFRTGRSHLRKMIGWFYVEGIRNIPVLVWIFIFYYFISNQLMQVIRIDFLAAAAPPWLKTAMRHAVADPANLSVFLSGLMALAVYEGAYVTEIIRAGIQSIAKGQWEAAAALGLSRKERMRHVIFPQAMRNILPPLAGQFISTIKDSAIVSVISIQELTFQGMELMAATFMTFEVWITIMVLYFLICLACSLAIERFELYLKKEAA